MSFLKYIQSKTRADVILSHDKYAEQLSAEVSGLLLKPTDKIPEIKKYIIDIHETSRILAEFNYPNTEKFLMALRSGDTKKINLAHSNFKHWSGGRDPLGNKIVNYKSYLYGRDLDPQAVDEIVSSFVNETKDTLIKVGRKVESAVENIVPWHAGTITVEAIYPEEGWIANEFRIYMDKFPICVYTENGLKNVESVDEYAPSIRDSLTRLFSRLQNDPKYSKVLTLFVSRPIAERCFYESLCRDLSLGIKTNLSGKLGLSTHPEGSDDIWKVKIEEKYLHREGDNYYILEDTPVRWIELAKKGNHEA